MKNKFLVIYLLTFLVKLTTTATAGPLTLKGSFSGIIREAGSNAPLAGVSVYIIDIKTGISTKADGSFNISNIPEGKHLIEVSHIGYTTIGETVEISGDTKKDYVMENAVVENDAVIITGSGAATQLKKSPFQVELLRKNDLLQSASSNIIDALAKKPGITALSSGPAISKPVIRGLGYNRVLTINDGVRQEGQQWGDEHGIEVDEASVTKVEILKGPASLLYGSDALAGVINIITNVPVENNTVKATVFSAYQTNNNSPLLHIRVAGNSNGFNWSIYNSISAAADYRNQWDGRVFNSKFRQQNTGGYIGYNGNWGYSHLLFSNFNLKAGLIEGDRDEDGFFVTTLSGGISARATDADFKSTLPLIPYQHIRHLKIASDNSVKLGKKRLSVNVGYQRNRREEFGNPDDRHERGLFFDLQTLTYTTQLHFPETNHWKTTAGINGMYQLNHNRGKEQLIPDYRLLDFGGYVYTQKTFRRINVSGGLRYDIRQVDASNLLEGTTIKRAGFTEIFSNFSGSIGMSAELNQQLQIKINVARGFRAPDIPELSSQGAHEGTNRYEYGNSQLKSETSLQADAGVEFSTEHISVNLCAFYNPVDNFIFYRKLLSAGGADSVVNDNGKSLTAFTFNQQKAVLSGIEAAIDIHPHPLDWLHFENSFSYTRGRFANAVEASVNLPFIPAAKINSELRCNFKKLAKGISNFYAKIELDNSFSQNRIFTGYNTETATPGYSLWSAGAGADFKAGEKISCSIHIAGNNLTDAAYQNHLSRLKYTTVNQATARPGVFNMGRNFSIKLLFALNTKLK